MRTVLALDERLPLTCTRAGTCCHGKTIWVNPWELAMLAHTQGRDVRSVRDTHTCEGGIRLRMDGQHRWRDRPACTFYAEGAGCSVHAGRPLACRLFPLGRERQAEVTRYVHEGKIFPCLDGCLEVSDLPSLSVGEYLAGQEVGAGEQAQDAYLEVVQDLAEGAFILLLDTDLHRQDPGMLGRWSRFGTLNGEQRARQLGKFWLDALTLTETPPHDAAAFIAAHRDRPRDQVQERYGRLNDLDAVRQGCETLFLLACHLGASLGAEPRELAELWVATAREQGKAEGG